MYKIVESYLGSFDQSDYSFVAFWLSKEKVKELFAVISFVVITNMTQDTSLNNPSLSLCSSCSLEEKKERKEKTKTNEKAREQVGTTTTTTRKHTKVFLSSSEKSHYLTC